MDTSNAENIAEMAAEPEAPTEVNFVWMFLSFFYRKTPIKLTQNKIVTF